MKETFLEDYTKLVIENARLRKELEELSEINKNGLCANMDMGEHIERLTDEIRDLEDENDQLEDTIIDLEAELNDLNDVVSSLESDIEDLYDQIDTLENQLDEMEG